MKLKLIGNKAFYLSVLTIALPIMLQNAVTSFVGLLDNLMVGRLGTLPMSGVSVVNTLLNIFYLITYATINASGLFLAQYCGKEDNEGMANCFRIKIYTTIILLVIGLVVFGCFGKKLIALYLLNNSADVIDTTLVISLSYLKIMLVGLVPFVFYCCISFSLRETGETVLPMVASITAVIVNLVLNYCLIFGHFGFMSLGSDGAAYATVVSRFVELFIVLFFMFLNRDKVHFLDGLLSRVSVPIDLLQNIIIKGGPLVLNEVFYAVGMAAVSQCYSYRGIDAVAAVNITTTISNLSSVATIAMGNAIAIMVGQRLGAGEIEKAKEIDNQLIFFSFCLNILVGFVLYLLSPLIPQLYNTSDEIRMIARRMIVVLALYQPIMSLYISSYFTVRSGGNTMLTLVFDGFFTVLVSLPVAFTLSHFTGLGIVEVYLITLMADLIKAFLGIYLILKGGWAKNIINN